jgi:hypothetical protein
VVVFPWRLVLVVCEEVSVCVVKRMGFEESSVREKGRKENSSS